MCIVESEADEIQEATQTLGFSAERFRRLPSDQAKDVYQSALHHFVPQGNPRWWWEHFPASTAVYFSDGEGWRCLTELVPDADERVWFIAEDSLPPEYSVWEASVRDIQAVVAESYFFEYSLVQQGFRWLLCETHHDMMVAVGAEVEAKLAQRRAT